MNAPAAVEKFVHSKLTASAEFMTLVGNKVYPSLAPGGAAPPYVILALRSGTKTQPLDQGEWSQAVMLYVVKAVTMEQNTFSKADKVARVIFNALKEAEGIVVHESREYYIRTAYQNEDVRYTAVENGERSNHVGGVYMFVVNPGEEI